MNIGKIKFMGFTYDVDYIKDHRTNYNMGEHLQKEGTILISQGMKPDTTQETLLHESCHIISDQLEIGLSEKQLAVFSVALFSFIKQNPEFIKQIIGNGKK